MQANPFFFHTYIMSKKKISPRYVCKEFPKIWTKVNTLLQLLAHVGIRKLPYLQIQTIQTMNFNAYYNISFNKPRQKLDMFDNNNNIYIYIIIEWNFH